MQLFAPTLSLLVILKASLSTAASSSHGWQSNLVVDEPPAFVRPYVIRDLSGPAFVLINDVIRAPITNESSGGAFSLLQLNAQPCMYNIGNV